MGVNLGEIAHLLQYDRLWRSFLVNDRNNNENDV